MIRHALTYMRAYMGKYIKNEKGQTMVEYGLIIALVAILLLSSLVLLRNDIAGIFEGISDKITEAEKGVTP